MAVAVARAAELEAGMGRWFTSWRTDTQVDVALLIIRLVLGLIMMAHGGQKLFGWFGGPGFGQAVANLTSGLGLTPVLGGLAILVEFAAGLAVFVGLLTRPAALALGLHQLVAALIVHLPNGLFLNWAGVPGRGHGVEMNLALVALAVALAVAGGGRFAADAALGRGRSPR